MAVLGVASGAPPSLSHQETSIAAPGSNGD
jgi:hypothetical protein